MEHWQININKVNLKILIILENLTMRIMKLMPMVNAIASSHGNLESGRNVVIRNNLTILTWGHHLILNVHSNARKSWEIVEAQF